jgi:hypothetical protein
MEDQDTCTTEVFLNADRSATFGRTDGPVPLHVTGSWQITPGTNDFQMTIVRQFKAGDKHKDVGEFTYDGTCACIFVPFFFWSLVVVVQSVLWSFVCCGLGCVCGSIVAHHSLIVVSSFLCL